MAMRYQPQGLMRPAKGWPGLTGLFNFTSLGCVDAVASRRPTFNTITGSPFRATRIGIGLMNNSMSAADSFLTATLEAGTTALVPGTDATFVWMGSLADLQYGGVMCRGDDSMGAGSSLRLSITSAGEARFSYVDTSPAAFTATTSGAGIGAGELVLLIGTKRGNTVTVYCKGKSASASGGNGNLRVSTRGVSLGYHGSSVTASPHGAAIHVLAATFSRAVSAPEVGALQVNPWQLFDDPTDEDELTVGAATAPNSYTLTAAPGAFGLSGASASLRVIRTLVGGNGSFSLTGTQAVLRAGRRVVGATGVITLAGGAAGLIVSRKLAGSPGEFVLASAAGALRASRALATSTGTFAISGSGGSLRALRRVSAAPAAFALTGADARLAAVRRLVANVGAFMLSGGAAQLVYSPVVEGNVLFTETGQFVLTGSAVGMRVMRRLQAGSGSFGHAGAVATIRCSRRMAGGQGAFVVASGAAVLRVTRRLSLAPGAFDLAGNPAVLAYGSTIEYARAPAGSGYTPQRNEYQVRPAQVGGSRPLAIQRNVR